MGLFIAFASSESIRYADLKSVALDGFGFVAGAEHFAVECESKAEIAEAEFESHGHIYVESGAVAVDGVFVFVVDEFDGFEFVEYEAEAWADEYVEVELLCGVEGVVEVDGDLDVVFFVGLVDYCGE